MQIFVSFGALAVLMEALPEIYLFSCAWTVPNPHQDSEVNSLWSMGKCNQGKSAKPMRNFGRSIGSKGWMSTAVWCCASARLSSQGQSCARTRSPASPAALRTADLELSLRRGI